ncbi:MAG: hypothetical protein V1743_03600 [Nanoarchaeota archaeon]
MNLRKSEVCLLSFALSCFFCMLASVSGQLMINEVMYNPAGPDNNQEFVEIKGTDNLSSYLLGDLSFNDSLELLQYVQGAEYSLVVEEGYNYTGLNCSIYSAGPTIGDNLGNDGDALFLIFDNSIVDSLRYDDSFADGTGYSLEIYISPNESIPFNDSTGKLLLESRREGGTPCALNSVYSSADEIENETEILPSGFDVSLSAEVADVLFLGITYSSLFKLRNLDHVSGRDENITVFVLYNITRYEERENNTVAVLVGEGMFNKSFNAYTASDTGRFTPAAVGRFQLCGRIVQSSAEDPDLSNNAVCKNFSVIDPGTIPCTVSLDLVLDKTVVENKERIVFENRLSDESFLFTISYAIVDIFGKEMKNVSTSNTNQKTYTPDIDEGFMVFFLRNSLDFIACNNSANKTWNDAMFIVKNVQERILVSTLAFTEVNPSKDGYTRFGDIVQVTLAAYKGDTGKKTIKIFIERDGEKVSETNQVNLEDKFRNYELVIPLFILPNCKGKYKEGYYDVVAEGLDTTARAQVLLQGQNLEYCAQTQEAKQSSLTGISSKTSSSSGVKKNSSKQVFEIISFYTRAKKFNEDTGLIRVFSSLRGKGNVEVILENRVNAEVVDRQELTMEDLKENETSKLEFNMSVRKAVNNLSLMMLMDQEVVAEKSFAVDFTAPELYLEVYNASASSNELKSKAVDGSESLDSVTSYAVLDGQTVYESKGARVKKYLNYAVVLPLIIGAAIFVAHKRKKAHAQRRDKGKGQPRLHQSKRHV